jgi:hypothetical protein
MMLLPRQLPDEAPVPEPRAHKMYLNECIRTVYLALDLPVNSRGSTRVSRLQPLEQRAQNSEGVEGEACGQGCGLPAAPG